MAIQITITLSLEQSTALARALRYAISYAYKLDKAEPANCGKLANDMIEISETISNQVYPQLEAIRIDSTGETIL